MKQTRINFALLALAMLIAGTLLFAGCTTTDSGDTSASDHSRHQGSCH